MDAPRVARPEELPAVIELAEHVFCVEFGRHAAMGRSFPYMLSEANIDNLYVTYERGRPVSFVGTNLHRPGRKRLALDGRRAEVTRSTVAPS